jgi:hypothetical protein
MKSLFSIFPKIGYKNSQFQIFSKVDNLKVDILHQNIVLKTVITNSKYPTLVTNVESIGKLVARCKFNGEEHEQAFEIIDAYRLGSSEFKKAFVFDDTDYSFFLMKDRLLLYDEEMKVLLTENHYSPSEIYKINNSNFLFVTKLGSETDGLVNLGVYSIDSFSLVAELLNDYREIVILPELNRIWLHDFKMNTLHCFEFVENANCHFRELVKYDNLISFFVDKPLGRLFINTAEKIYVVNLKKINNSIEIPKLPNNSINKMGDEIRIEKDILIVNKCFSKNMISIRLKMKLNLDSENFIHIGEDIKNKNTFEDLQFKVEGLKDEILENEHGNRSYIQHVFHESDWFSESYEIHDVYSTLSGVFLVQREKKRIFKGLKLRKNQGEWIATAITNETSVCTLSFFSAHNQFLVHVDKARDLSISEYCFPMLMVEYQGKKSLFIGGKSLNIEEGEVVDMFTVNNLSYFFKVENEKYSLFNVYSLNNPILNQIVVLNPGLYKKHQVVWYSAKEQFIFNKKHLRALDLKSFKTIFFDERKIQHSVFKDASAFKFFEKYALSSNQVVFNPLTLEIKDAFIGNIESHSKHLNKIVSHRTNNIYLSIFNPQIKKYELSEISFDEKKYKESYLSPDGQFLVLQDESNKYSYYDIEKGKTISFISGNFLAFRNDGSVIVEQDINRAVKIFDPITFQDVTPPNYHHYRFMSPDGRLYAQIVDNVRYLNRLNKSVLNFENYLELKKLIDPPISGLLGDLFEKAKSIVEKNRLQLFDLYKEKCIELNIKDSSELHSNKVIQIERYVEVGICGTNIVKEVFLPDDTQFYNYAAFSFDNKYLGIVGKPYYNSINKSLILFCSILFDENNNSLEIKKTVISRIPKKASWVCGFSKTDFFATYDSTPDTYIINVDENLFENKTNEIELRQNFYKSKKNIYHTYNKWNVIKGKNFLCFSPSGDYLALSEQGYKPLTLGGYGHQESNVVHVAKTQNDSIIDSFTGHGDVIKHDKTKKVIFVAFSEDENRIMTLSADGVVIIRNIKVLKFEKNEQVFENCNRF